MSGETESTETIATTDSTEAVESTEAETTETAPEQVDSTETEAENKNKLFTQEELNEKISKRVSNLKAELEGYEDLKKKHEEVETSYNDILNKHNSAVAERDRFKIASEYSFGEDELELVSGTSYEEMKASAERLQNVIGKKKAETVSSSLLTKKKEYIDPDASDSDLAKYAKDLFKNYN